MKPPYERAGFQNERAYRMARKRAQEWSDQHSRAESSRYEPKMKPEQFKAYFQAYASEATGVTARRKRHGKGHMGPSRYVMRYVVNVMHYYTPDEFGGRYAELR